MWLEKYLYKTPFYSSSRNIAPETYFTNSSICMAAVSPMYILYMMLGLMYARSLFSSADGALTY